ncbi:hypothetical protein ONS95_008294 [Cadophora gregata]|uniref:uncharacterized protein n=1 Tax=Cadophora gregata TaxID=51156 RepID=UPI0026DD46F2|nr:uncharacterized protein ONS95_008294 [Cadophora gregata]KAK0126712.1 hypothetical protein ONS95_008294 [Cadophora gregata]
MSSSPSPSPSSNPLPFNLSLTKFQPHPTQIQAFCHSAQQKWQGATEAHHCVRDVLREYRRLFGEMVGVYEEFVGILGELRGVRDGVVREGGDEELRMEMGGWNEEKGKGKGKEVQENSDVVATSEKENVQAQSEEDNSSQTDSALASSVRQQDDAPSGDRHSGVVNHVRGAVVENVENEASMNTDGAVNVTQNGSLLVPAVPSITLNGAQIPNMENLGFQSTTQLQESNDTSPLPSIKTLGFPSTKKLQQLHHGQEQLPGLKTLGFPTTKQLQEANGATPLPSIRTLLDRKKSQGRRNSRSDRGSTLPI